VALVADDVIAHDSEASAAVTKELTMPDTTLSLVFLFVTIATLGALLIVPRRLFQTGHAGLGPGDPFRFVAKGLLRVVAWFATGLAIYGLVFGYTGSSASVLMDSSADTRAAGGPSERGLASVGAHITHGLGSQAR
jgi:hypothetical protein